MASRTVSTLEAPKLEVSIFDRGWIVAEVASESVRELLTTEPLAERVGVCELRWRFLLSPPLLVWDDPNPKTMDRLEDREYLLAIVTEVVGAKAEDGCARSDRARAATVRVNAVDRDIFLQCVVDMGFVIRTDLCISAASGVSDL